MLSGNRSLLLLSFVVALLLLRQVTDSLEIYHFQPYAALFFCLAALRKTLWLLIPFAAYLISTVLAVGGLSAWMLSPLLGYALIVAWGRCFQPKSGVVPLLAGSVGGAGIFYLVTNTISWLTIPGYLKTFEGFTQALWTGLPGFPPTWTFFRNDAVATVLFTAIILVLQRFPQQKKAEAAVAAQA